MQFEHKYFEDEVRDGFYVDSMMKKAGGKTYDN